MLALVTTSNDPNFFGHSFIIQSISETDVTLMFSQKDRREFTLPFEHVMIAEIDLTIWQIKTKDGFWSHFSEAYCDLWMNGLTAYCQKKGIVPYILTDDNHANYPQQSIRTIAK